MNFEKPRASAFRADDILQKSWVLAKKKNSATPVFKGNHLFVTNPG